MRAQSAEVALVVAAVKTELPAKWAQWGGGWPNEVEAALLDAVLSIRSRYGKKPTSGVRRSVGRYRVDRDTSSLDDLDVLAGYSLDRLTAVLDNRQKTGGVPKAQALINAAGILSTAGIRHADELNPTSVKHRAAYCSVKGLGPVTWTYFTMLLGQPGVKADTWIVRFTTAAVGRPVTAFQAEQIITGAATELGVSSTDLDHAIWCHLSAKPPTGG
jgi:hypothetical protein